MSISREQYETLVHLIEESKAIVNKELSTSEGTVELDIWNNVQEQIAFIENTIKNLEVPTTDQKNQVTLGVQLARTFASPADSLRLAPLFELDNEFRALGIPKISDEESLNLFE